MKRYYTEDVTELLGVHRKTLYGWEKRGKILRAKRDPISRYRYWTEEDIKILKKKTGR